MGIFNQTCSSCGKANDRDARFCVQCGGPLQGGKRKCGNCGRENDGNGKFCNYCGQPLGETAAADIHGHHWARGSADFAVKVEAEDVKGLFKRGLIIEAGTRALFLVKGASQGEVPPGEYNLDSILGRLRDWVATGIPERATVLLVDLAPADLDFHLGGRLTRDDQRIGVTVRLQVKVKEAGKFLLNILKGRERFTLEDLRQYLYPDVVQVVDAYLRHHTLQEMVEDSTTRAKLQQTIEMEMETTFSQAGLELVQARTVELNLEAYDHIRSERSRYNLLVEESEVKTQGETRLAELDARAKMRWVEISKLVDLADQAERNRLVEKQMAEAEVEEKKSAVLERMRQAVLSDKMKEVRSEADFEKFVDQIDLEKLLSAHERENLLLSWKEAAEDHTRERAYLLTKLDVERRYEMQMIELLKSGQYSEVQLDQQQGLVRKKADFDWELRRQTAEQEYALEVKKLQLQVERAKLQDEVDEITAERARKNRSQERTDDEEDAMMGMRILEKMKQIRRLDDEESLRIIRENELATLRERQRLDLERQEAEERRRQAEREHEIRIKETDAKIEVQRIEAMGKLNYEALISLAPADKAGILADLKRNEAFKSMTADQIMAAVSANSPEVAKALQEKFRAAAEGQASQREREMYERWLTEREASSRRLQEEADKRVSELRSAQESAAQRAQQTAERALDRMADTAQAFARSQGQNSQAPIIITPSGSGPQVFSPSTGGTPGQTQPSKVKNCPKCGHIDIEVEARFCTYCGYHFEG